MTISDIVEEIYNLSDTDSTSYPAAKMLRRINASYEKVVGRIMLQDGNWEFDDTNFTDFPRGKADLVAAQKDYGFDSSHLAIESVQVLDSNGKYYYLRPISKADYSIPLDEYFETDGLPLYYDKDGKSVLIYPGPAAGDVTTTDGLLVHFRRTASVFTSGEVTTGTKSPGFASPYHMIIAYESALVFCITYKPERVARLKAEVQELWKGLLDFYAKRAKDEKTVMTNRGISSR